MLTDFELHYTIFISLKINVVTIKSTHTGSYFAIGRGEIMGNTLFIEIFLVVQNQEKNEYLC